MQSSGVSRSKPYSIFRLMFCLIAGILIGDNRRLQYYILGAIGLPAMWFYILSNYFGQSGWICTRFNSYSTSVSF